MPTRVFLPLRPLPRNAAYYRERSPYGPTQAGGFETALSIEIDARRLAQFGQALAVTDGIARVIPEAPLTTPSVTPTAALVLKPTPAAQRDIAATLGIRGAVVVVYRHLDLASVVAAATAVIQALGPRDFPSPLPVPQRAAAFANGDFPLSVQAGMVIGQPSQAGAAQGFAELGFEIVFVPGGLWSDGSATPDPAWVRLQQLIDRAAETRRLDPIALFVAATAPNAQAGLDPSHANHALLILATRRVLIEVRNEYDAPFDDLVTIQRGAAAPVTAPVPLGSRGTFVVDTQPQVGPPANLQYVVSSPDCSFTELPSGDTAVTSPTRTMQPPTHWTLQGIFMSQSPGNEEFRNWFVANTGGLPRYTENNRVTPLRDGVTAMREIATAIRTLTSQGHSVFLAAWVLVDDFRLIPSDATSTFAQLSTAAANNGASVRALLYDDTNLAARFPFVGQGNLNNAPRARINALPNGNGRAILDDVIPGVAGAHHQKSLFVNGSGGAIAFCGGMDINGDRLDSSAHGALGAFHDVHVRVEGPAVGDIHQTFVQRWNNHPATIAAPATALPTTAPAFAPNPGTEFVQVARTFSPSYTRSGHYPFVAMDNGSLTPLHAIQRAVQRAQHFIYIEDQYLTPYARTAPFAAAGDTTGLVHDLIDALARISHLIIVIPNHCDQPQNRFRRQQFIQVLLNVAPTKVDVFFLARGGVGATPTADETAVTGGGDDSSGGAHFRGEVYIHSKLWIVDDVAVKIGSSNLNRRSLTSDSEIDVVVIDGALDDGARRFARRFRTELWAEHLNLSGAQRALLEDVEMAAQLFRTPPTGARIRPYNHNADIELIHTDSNWDSRVDPDDQ